MWWQPSGSSLFTGAGGRGDTTEQDTGIAEIHFCWKVSDMKLCSTGKTKVGKKK